MQRKHIWSVKVKLLLLTWALNGDERSVSRSIRLYRLERCLGEYQSRLDVRNYVEKVFYVLSENRIQAL
jgi:hypothetical protein